MKRGLADKYNWVGRSVNGSVGRSNDYSESYRTYRSEYIETINKINAHVERFDRAPQEYQIAEAE